MSELSILDPFGDYAVRGYLRNHLAEKDLAIVGHLETASFQAAVLQTVRSLRRTPLITYELIKLTHQRLFSSIYPWAGQDRLQNAPDIAIVKAGYNTLFAHPKDIRRAAEYALSRAFSAPDLRAHPGEIFAYLAHAHPFLEGNGRTILTVFAELCRRASFRIEWEAIDKSLFLRSLTSELLSPGTAMDALLLGHVREGVLSSVQQARRLHVKFGPGR